MSRRISPLTLDNVGDLPTRCRGCVAWELDRVAATTAARDGTSEFEKEMWISNTLLEWGSCGRVMYAGEDAVGYMMYAPPVHVPRSFNFPTSPVSPDAVVLMGGWVDPDHRGAGYARMAIQSAAKDLTRRGFRAIEAFGYASSVAPEDAVPSLQHQDHVPVSIDQAKRAGGLLSEGPVSCLMPGELFVAVGFRTIRQHPRVPRYRLDLRTALSWREDVEAALEKIFDSVRQPALASVAGGCEREATSINRLSS